MSSPAVDPTLLDGPNTPSQPPVAPEANVVSFRQSAEGKKLSTWLLEEYSRAKTARRHKEAQWYLNMSMTLGNQWIKAMPKGTPTGFDTKFVRQPQSYYRDRRTINRIRAFVRLELSKFISQQPSIISVPSTGDDEDVRASLAAEQVWESVSDAKKLRYHYSKAAWWMIVTGNGFLKTEWDAACTAPDGTPGDIKYSAITPFNLFVPDMRDPDIEGQPYIITAYTKSIDWVRQFWSAELAGIDLKGTADGSASLIDESYLNLQRSSDRDVVVVTETWLKPGATPMLPDGGLVIMVGDTMVGYWKTYPYSHGMFPITHFGHLDTGGFYRDSPIVDLQQLQREYNMLRTEFGETARRAARPQIMAQQGSIVTSRMSNEAMAVVQVRPGTPMPQPLPMQGIPAYAVQQQDRVLQDFEDISGQHDVTKGQAPAGVSAGTAINYLQEAANSFFTPQFQTIEFGHENVAIQTLGLFVQYVDFQRKIKTVGADGSFDALWLTGSEISSGVDMRVEANSSAPQSQAAVRAFAMDLFSIGAIQQPDLMKMLELNGFQRMMDVLKVAERKAQRENIQIKKLSVLDIEQATLVQQQQLQQALPQMLAQAQATGQPLDPEILQAAQGGGTPPLMIPVDDFDNHAVHITVHNAFRMGQQYPMLPQSIKDQFAMHVAMHQQYMQQQQMQQLLSQIPQDPAAGGDAAPQPAGPADAGGAGGAGSSEAQYLQQQASEQAQGATNQHYNIGG